MDEITLPFGMQNWPLWALVLGLFVSYLGRSHLSYWLGRGLSHGAGRLAPRSEASADASAPAGTAALTDDPLRGALPPLPHPDQTGTQARLVRLLHTPAARRGLMLVHRFGPFAVTFAYLLSGVQTVVFVGSGVLRMSYPRFFLASIPGSLARALIVATIGFAVFWAAVRLASASPWALAGVLVLVAVAVTALVLRRRARRVADAPAPVAADR